LVNGDTVLTYSFTVFCVGKQPVWSQRLKWWARLTSGYIGLQVKVICFLER
jgi:hypothetical protein